jgi:hypothetical protein
VRAVLSVLLVVFGAVAQGEALPEKELIERMSVFGDGFLVGSVEAPVINEPARWIGRRSGDYVYRFTKGSDDGALVQTERHIPDEENPDRASERHIGERVVETFVSSSSSDVLIVEEVDHRHGFRMEIKPGIHWPADVRVGDEWVIDADLAVYEVDTGEFFKDGKLRSTITYEGAFRVRTPAGEFDAILMREDFLVHIGPLQAEDDRFLFFARDVGLVAEIEAIRASALLLLHVKEDSAKVLQSYPQPAGT